MATKPKRPRDTSQLAKLIVDISTGQVKDEKSSLRYRRQLKKPSKGKREKT
jgi:hypothetical protein